MGDVIEFRPARTPDTPPASPEITDRYIGQFVPDIIDLYAELGADGSYLGILGRQLADTRLGIREGWKSSGLSFETIYDKDGIHTERRLNVARPELTSYKGALKGALALHQVLGRLGTANTAPIATGYRDVYAGTSPTETPAEYKDKMLTKLAMDWVLFEYSADMFSYSYAMQRRFDRYVPDYGTVPSDHDYLAVAENFMSTYGNNEDPHAFDNAVRGEHAAFRQGVALQLLKQDLVRRDIVSSLQHASWITHYLSVHYPKTRQNSVAVEPLNHAELTKRVSELEPRTGMAAYYNAYFEHLDTDEDDWSED